MRFVIRLCYNLAQSMDPWFYSAKEAELLAELSDYWQFAKMSFAIVSNPYCHRRSEKADH